MSETVTSQDQAEDQTGAEAGAETGRPPEDATRAERSSEDQLVREGDIAGDYLERLLDILDFDGDIDLDVEAGRAVVSVDGGKDLEKLVGARGDVLEALQELTRLAVQQSTGTRNRLMLDVAGWRSQRRSELTDLGRTAASGGEGHRAPPAPAAHDAVRAQDRARRGGRDRRGAQRERGRGAPPSRRGPPDGGLSTSVARTRGPDAARSTWNTRMSTTRGDSADGAGRGRAGPRTPGRCPAPPAAAAAVFGDRLAAAERYVALLAGPGQDQGVIGPRELPRLWDRHVLNSAAVGEVLPLERDRRRRRVRAPGSPASRWPSRVRTSHITLLEPMARRVAWLEQVVAELGLPVDRRPRAGPRSARRAAGAGRATSSRPAPWPRWGD